MGQIGTLTVFTNGTIASGTDVSTNFDTVKTTYNTHDTAITGVHGIGAATAIPVANIDWSLNTIFTKSISGDTNFTFSNNTAGSAIYVLVTASGTNAVTWPTVKWPGGAVPTQTASGVDLYSFIMIGTTVYGTQVTDMR